jgi:prevent-host-death family protein
MVMKEIAISEFKAKCLAILEQVNKTKHPVLITRFGKPVAEVVPPSPKSPRDVFGFMLGSVEILGDVISPASDPKDWEVVRD